MYNSFIYIASPYSDKAKTIREARYRAVMSYAAHLINQGSHCFSPILHCHEMAKYHDMPMDSSFWREWNYSLLDQASEIHVLMLDGWGSSMGINDEVERSVINGIDIYKINPETYHFAQ